MMFSHSKKENDKKENRSKNEDNNKKEKKNIFNFLYLGSRVLRIKEKR